MAIRCIIGPASSGKTAWVIQQARKHTAGLQGTPRVIVPSHLLVKNFRRRVAESGGGLGIEVGTLADLAGNVLDRSGIAPILLSEHIQKQLLKEIINSLDLSYYRAIQGKAGFFSAVLGFIGELKAGAIKPSVFLKTLKSMPGNNRLRELGQIYLAYQHRLQKENWADSTGQIWMASERVPEISSKEIKGRKIYLDGFDDLSPVQLQFIQALADRGGDIAITLTGAPDGVIRTLVHKRFIRLREMLKGIGGSKVSLAQVNPGLNQPKTSLKALEEVIFRPMTDKVITAGDRIEMAAVPDREAEVRTALRWIKHKLLEDKIKPREAALLVRNQEFYRQLVIRIAEEYELPLFIQGGIPLIENPAVAAIWRLVQMANTNRKEINRHQVLAFWNSPYMDWERIGGELDGEQEPYQHFEDARMLEMIARWGRVTQGIDQWREAFQELLNQDIDLGRNGSLPDIEFQGQQSIVSLEEKFSRFLGLLQPPEGKVSLDVHLSWLEDKLGRTSFDQHDESGIFRNILEGPARLVERDWSAIESLFQLLGEMRKVDHLLNRDALEFRDFVADLEIGLQQTNFQPQYGSHSAVTFADCREARGVPFKAIALIGIAEGEFPKTIQEDPFLRDDERVRLRNDHGLPIQLSVDSAEAEFFYEAVTRPSKFLLLTRPRITDEGAPWQASPYWEEVARLVDRPPRKMSTRSVIPLEQAASMAEYLEIAAANKLIPEVRDPALLTESDLIYQQITNASLIIKLRSGKDYRISQKFEGNLSEQTGVLEKKYGAAYVWSASRLESYQTCPFKYFVENLLGLEKMELVDEGLDARQLGNIYHRILEKLYNDQEEDYTVQDLLKGLPGAAKKIFRNAPQEEGFRASAWWEHTQSDILNNLRYSLIVLENLQPGYRFFSAEHKFGIYPDGEPCLEIQLSGGEKYYLRGLIDRLDLSKSGHIRVIDYKTSGPHRFTARAVQDGKKLQLPLYALAAESQLGEGRVKEGFYFHLQAASPSGFQMSSFSASGKEGPKAAMQVAADQGWKAVSAIRAGLFGPKPPQGGCPSYCPAVEFCWKYQPKSWQ